MPKAVEPISQSCLLHWTTEQLLRHTDPAEARGGSQVDTPAKREHDRLQLVNGLRCNFRSARQSTGCKSQLSGLRVDLTVGFSLPNNVRFPRHGNEVQFGTHGER